jgi:hypothetical protein
VSTRTTIAEVNDGLFIETEYRDDSVWVCGVFIKFSISHDAPFLKAEFELCPELIDEIARLHARQAFPHQASKGGDN